VLSSARSGKFGLADYLASRLGDRRPVQTPSPAISYLSAAWAYSFSAKPPIFRFCSFRATLCHACNLTLTFQAA
jgi:hypothetical protein